MGGKRLHGRLDCVKTAFMVLLSLVSTTSFANNPLVSHVYTADPAARVFNGRMCVITSHDLGGQSGYDMHDYNMFSSDDMINLRDHGIVFDARTNTSWASLAYAPDLIFWNNKYYLYFPNGAASIGVAVSNNPVGPYTDPLGRSLVDSNTPHVELLPGAPLP